MQQNLYEEKRPETDAKALLLATSWGNKLQLRAAICTLLKP